MKISEYNNNKHLLDAVSKDLAPLEEAYQLQAIAATVGFDWTTAEDVVKKINEEIAEFMVDYQTADKEKMIDEMGDILMAVVNLARFTDINPAIALKRTITKFRQRFALVEQELWRRGKEPQTSTLEEMDNIWNEIKKNK